MWNPNIGIEMFEPGCIQCSECGHKPEDLWDDAPEGFTYTQFLGWLCEDCGGNFVSQITED